MFYAGIGCSERGYCLTVLDSSGSDYSTLEVRPGAAALDSVIETLRQGVDPADGQLRCFVDSYTGALAGLLVEADLDVYRLDLPFVTIPADTRLLAQAGRMASGHSTRLDLESGFLRGRVDELVALWDSCADLEAELAQAGSFFPHRDPKHRGGGPAVDRAAHPTPSNRAPCYLVRLRRPSTT